jgi:hypothetical protein
MIEEPLRVWMRHEQAFDAGPKLGLAGASLVEIGGALAWGLFQGGEEDGFGGGHLGHGLAPVWGVSNQEAVTARKTHHGFLGFSPSSSA